MTAIVVLSTMGKPNPIHVFLLLLVTLASNVSAEQYYIVANDSTSQCQNYSAGTCLTLAEFASNSSYLDQDNLTLSFLPGQHLLTRRLTIIGPQNITVMGQNSSNSLSSTIKCQGTSGFAFGDIQSLKVEYLEFTGCGNVERGGAIHINKADNVLIRGCHFTDNHVAGEFSRGGAIYAENTVAMNIEESFFDNNYAAQGRFSDGGAIFVDSGNIYSTNDHYINNSAVLGGAISVDSGNITSTNDHYINNSAGYDGGAIFVLFGNITSTNDHYINNSADNAGGAISVLSGNITSTNDHYINNSGGYGGAIFVSSDNISSTNDHYINNSAGYGGAIYVTLGNITSTNDQYTNNSAERGGAIYDASDDDTKLSGANFEHNSAGEGAVIYKTGGTLVIGQSNITDNFASSKGTVYVNSGTLSLSERVNFMNNNGSLYVFNTQVEFKGIVAFINNFADSGGAITAFLSEISFNTASTVTIFNNTATNGGGISLIQSNMHVYHSIELTDNHATDFGGGIYAYQSDIEFKPEQTQRSKITKNTASKGGAVCAIASNIHISCKH